MTASASGGSGFAATDDDGIRLDRLRSLGTLLDGLAHEVNNLLHHLTLNLPVVNEAWRDATVVLDVSAAKDPGLRLGNLPYSELRNGLPDLLEEGVRRAGNVRRLLALLGGYVGRDHRAVSEAVCVAEVVGAAEALMTGAMRSAMIRFSSLVAADLPLVRGDRRQLLQVLVHLLSAACDSTASTPRDLVLRTVRDVPSGGVVLELERRGFGPAVTAGVDPVIERIIVGHGGSLRLEAGAACTIRIHLPPAG